MCLELVVILMGSWFIYFLASWLKGKLNFSLFNQLFFISLDLFMLYRINLGNISTKQLA